MTYRPAFVDQFDGSRCGQYSGSYNCVVAAAAMDLDRDTRGASRTTPAALREIIGGPCGGLTLGQADEALTSAAPGRDHLDVRPRMTWAGLMAELDAGRGAMLMIDYSPLVGGTYDCFSGRFAGTHCVFVNERSAGHLLWADPGADGRRPDVPRGWQSIPEDLARRAAGAFPGVGLGYAQAGLSRDTEPAYKAHVAAGAWFQHYELDGLRIAGHTRTRTRAGFIVTCTAPRLYRWDAAHPTLSPRSLVQLSNPRSARYGWYIGAQYATPIPGTGG